MTSKLSTNDNEVRTFKSYEAYKAESNEDYRSNRKAIVSGVISKDSIRSSESLVNLSAHYILGSSIEQVATASLDFIAYAEYKDRVDTLIYCLSFAFMLSQTTSNNLSDEYAKIPRPHMFESFEIRNRDSRRSAVTKWEERSEMNGTAIRLLGHLVLECAYRDNNPLAINIINDKGSIFRKVSKPSAETSTGESIYTKLCNENFLGNSKENLIREWCSIYYGPVNVVMSLFGTGSENWKFVVEKTKDIRRTKV